MNRQEFLKNLGLSGGAIFATYCLGLSGCSSNDPTPNANVDFTLNLNDTANASLKVNGGFVINSSQRVVVARTNTGTFVAATIVCSHEGETKVSFNGSANEFQCAAHGARFDTAGKGLNANGSKGLKIYKTTYDATANTLRITS